MLEIALNSVISFANEGIVEVGLAFRASIVSAAEDTLIDSVAMEVVTGDALEDTPAGSRVLECGIVCHIAINSALQGNIVDGLYSILIRIAKRRGLRNTMHRSRVVNCSLINSFLMTETMVGLRRLQMVD